MVQATQVPLQAVSQRTPSTQAPAPQLVAAVHGEPGQVVGHGPPQSTPVSPWFLRPSWQVPTQGGQEPPQSTAVSSPSFTSSRQPRSLHIPQSLHVSQTHFASARYVAIPVAFGAAHETTFFGSCSVHSRIAVHEALPSHAARSFAHESPSAHALQAPQLALQLTPLAVEALVPRWEPLPSPEPLPLPPAPSSRTAGWSSNQSRTRPRGTPRRRKRYGKTASGDYTRPAPRRLRGRCALGIRRATRCSGQRGRRSSKAGSRGLSRDCSGDDWPDRDHVNPPTRRKGGAARATIVS